MHKVPTPDFVESHSLGRDCRGSALTPLSGGLTPNSKSFHTSNALHQFTTRFPPFPLKHRPYPTVAITWIFPTEPYNTPHHVLIPLLGLLWAVLATRTMKPQISASSPHRTHPFLDNPLHCLPLGRGAHHFFFTVSSNTRILSISSASIFLSCVFSFSSSLKRLRSAIFIRPYLRRHR